MKIPAQDADLWLFPNFIQTQQCSKVFEHLRAEIAWQQDMLTMYGNQVAIPRLQAWYGDKNAHYQYSGLSLTLNDWLPVLTKFKKSLNEQVSTIIQQPIMFNSVLANLYRDHQDTVGWHSDDEVELGKKPVIASISLGAKRDFKLKHKLTGEKLTIPLTSGSLLIMAGNTQHCWQHAVLRVKTPMAERINLTFRQIK